jgi:hypothetical protein
VNAFQQDGCVHHKGLLLSFAFHAFFSPSFSERTSAAKIRNGGDQWGGGGLKGGDGDRNGPNTFLNNNSKVKM